MDMYVVGLGPGSINNITPKVASVLKECDVVVGYTTYIDLIKPFIRSKKVVATAMKKERERCEEAVALALQGQSVVMVSSGDPGVYGMASLLFEVAKPYEGLKVQVLPGITAALSGGAILGAPLSNDFAVISLSDLLTPWPLIEKRLRCAAEGGFSICLYNPSSKKRKDHLKKACDIMAPYIHEDTPCGYVMQIDREGEAYEILTFKALRDAQVDMFTTVFIGNEQTQVIKGKIVTSRGYKNV